MEVFLLDGNKRKFQGYPLDSKENLTGTFLAAQRLGLHAFTVRGPDSIPGEGTKISQAKQGEPKNKENIAA